MPELQAFGTNDLVPLTVPDEYSDLYQDMQSQLQSFNDLINSEWNGSKNPNLVVGGEVMPVDAYAQLNDRDYYASKITPYLNALQQIGARCVKVKIDFPMLYQPWYQLKYGPVRGPQEYQDRLDVYTQFADDVRARGMKLIIQSVVVPAQGGSQDDQLGMSDYYPTLSDSEYGAGRIAQVIAVAELLKPDFLNFSSEPDNEGIKGLRPSLDPSKDPKWMDNNVTLVSQIIAALEAEAAAGRLTGLHSSMKTAIGVGPWTSPRSDFESLVARYVALGVDIIDVHSHVINKVMGNDFLDNIRYEMDEAIKAGKAVGMNEQWIYYERNSELGRLDAQTVESRNNWSFWIPLDTLYMQVLTDLAHWKKCVYLSFSSPQQFFAKLNYAETSDMSSTALATAQSLATTIVINANRLVTTDVGKAFTSLSAVEEAIGAGV